MRGAVHGLAAKGTARETGRDLRMLPYVSVGGSDFASCRVCDGDSQERSLPLFHPFISGMKLMNRKAGQANVMPDLRFLMVPPIRFERTTPALGERCSIP